MGSVGKWFGGGPSGSDVSAAGQNLHDPNAANYQIAGVPQYQNALGNYGQLGLNTVGNGAGAYNANAAGAGLANQAAATNLIGQTAAGNGPSLAKANLQAGLSQQANQLQSQAMSNQGNTAGGLSQRNLLNAQAAAGNSMVQNAGTASVAEQLGAQSNYASAANAQSQGQMSNSLNASNAGLAQNQAVLQAANQAAQYATAGQQQNDQQAQNNMGLDAAQAQYGQAKTNIALQAAGADASQAGAVGKFVGNVAQAAAVASDEDVKKDIRQGSATDSQIGKFLHGFMASSDQSKAAGSSGGAQPQQPENPYSSFAPAMLKSGSGVLEGGGAKANYSGGLNSSLSGMSDILVKNKTATPDPTIMPAGAGVGSIGAVKGGSLGPPPGDTSVPVWNSDENGKKDIASDHSHIASFMDSMEPSTFKYKDQSYSPGMHMGVMAQDVDDSKMGADMVQETPQGKAINVPKAMGASLAGLAYLNERMDKLEKKKGASYAG